IGTPPEHLLAELTGQNGIAVPKGPAGSALFFEGNLLHGSCGNISPWPRTNLFYCYNSVENPLQEPFCGLPPRPEYVSTRKNTAPLRAQQPDYRTIYGELE